MLSKKMHEALNEQVKHEIFSSYIYKSMALYFEDKNYNGMANWMKAQSAEEWGHAERIIDYIVEQGGKVELQALDKPPTDWTNPLAVFEDALKHEQFITGKINKLVDMAHEENDHASHYFLGWFVREQVEEESSVGAVVDKLKVVGDNVHGLFMMDAHLGRRE
jgi:ferritin